jgi:hypothetical protein
VARPIVVAGTDVSLDAPEIFVAAREFPGIVWSNAAGHLLASVHVAVMQAPVQTSWATVTAEALASRGIVLVHREQAHVEGRDALLVEATQQKDGNHFRKWWAIFGDATRTVMVVGTIGDAALPEQKRMVREIVTSASWRGTSR